MDLQRIRVCVMTTFWISFTLSWIIGALVTYPRILASLQRQWPEQRSFDDVLIALKFALLGGPLFTVYVLFKDRRWGFQWRPQPPLPWPSSMPDWDARDRLIATRGWWKS